MNCNIRNKAIFKAAGIAAAAVIFCAGCDDKGTSGGGGGGRNGDGDNPGVVYGPPVTYGGQIYQTVKIGTQTWFAENLNYNAEGSKCYGEDRALGADDTALSPAEVQANCAKYGRLYDWETALTVCPAGWHLPDTTEWNRLENAAGGRSTAGKKLKSTSGWRGNGTNQFGFSALPGGYGNEGNGIQGSYSYVDEYGYWWTASSKVKNYAALYRFMCCGLAGVGMGEDGYLTHLISVRCVQN